mmetsp:Transcript_3259/g.6500  ORF Transcript_3259/g.6500 Transcript_3259/m.6500 type:complete len:263 (-) Transcript_3259:1163-1951(-)
MPKHRPDAAIVARLVVLLIEEGRLQDPRGDPQAVVGRAVEGVDGCGRAAPPLAPAGLLREILEANLHREAVAHAVVGPQALAHQPVEGGGLLRPVLLALRIGRDAHLKEHCLKLLLSSKSILRGHPRLDLERRRELLPDLAQHVRRRRHVAAVEHAVCVKLGSRPPCSLERRVVALAGAGAFLLDTIDVLLQLDERVEELLGERGARAVHQLPPHERLDCLDRVLLEDGPKLGEEAHRLHQQRLAALLPGLEHVRVAALGTH